MTTPDTFDALVRSLSWEADGVLSVELVRPDRSALPGFEAGAHVDLHLPNGLTRSYSLCSMPGETQRWVIGVGKDRASRGGSRWVHEQLRPGQTLRLTGPRNHFRLNEAAPRFALVAGGIGVTPVLAMARPAHKVEVSRFCMDIYEVTTEDYVKCSDKGECKRAFPERMKSGITVIERAVLIKPPAANADIGKN